MDAQYVNSLLVGVNVNEHGAKTEMAKIFRSNRGTERDESGEGKRTRWLAPVADFFVYSLYRKQEPRLDMHSFGMIRIKISNPRSLDRIVVQQRNL